MCIFLKNNGYYRNFYNDYKVIIMMIYYDKVLEIEEISIVVVCETCKLKSKIILPPNVLEQ